MAGGWQAIWKVQESVRTDFSKMQTAVANCQPLSGTGTKALHLT